MNKNGVRGVAIGMAGSGAIFTVIALFADNPFWFLVTGSVFLVIGLLVYFIRGR